MSKLSTLALLFSSLMLAAVESLASTVQFGYEGIINKEFYLDSSGLTPFNEFTGELVKVSLLFETDPALNPDLNPNPDKRTGRLTSLTIELGGNTYVGTNGQIRVENGPSYDFFSVDVQPDNTFSPDQTISGPSLGALPFSAMSINFFDYSSSVFSDDTLPLTAPDPADFVPDSSSSNTDITLGFYDPQISGGTVAIVRAEGNVQLSPVPIPAAAWLFVSALGVFGLLSKRKANA